MDLQRRIDDRLNQLFNFKKVGEWYRQGRCPSCNEKELYTHAETPRMVKCGRINKCGYEEHVKDICEDLFKDWSEYHPKTPENPNAAADAYLKEGRGFDLRNLKGRYSQELYQFPKNKSLVSATVRFKLAEGIYWERIIDRPDRFGRQKANFIGKWTGLAWSMHELDELCHAGSIWITEGIFNSIALSQSAIISISNMNSGNYPTQILDAIKKRCHELNKDKPRLVWALDNDQAGKKFLSKHHKHATDEGWISTAALPPVPINGKSLDWNDLFQREQLTEKDREKYLHFGKLQIVDTPEEAGLLIYNFYGSNLSKFFFNHKFRTYWWELDYEKFNKAVQYVEESQQNQMLSEEEIRIQALKTCSSAKEICNAQLEPLYFQRNEITDESWYYFHLQRALLHKPICKGFFSDIIFK